MTPGTTQDTKFYTRNKIKSRLLKKAAELWGYQEWEMDAFDPLINLLIEANSVEFEKLYTEINTTQNRILERLSHILIPEVTDTVHPACGIMQSRAQESSAFLHADTQFILKRQFLPGAKNLGKDTDAEIFFTPLQKTKLFNASIEYIATDLGLWHMEKSVSKNLVTSRSYTIPKSYHSLWIGIHLHESIKNIQGLSFFFDWFNEPDKHWYLQYLTISKWLFNKKLLTPRYGLWEEVELEEVQKKTILEDEFNPLKKIEQQIRGLFSSHYITLNENTPVNSADLRPYPEEFETLFSKEGCKELKKPLLWLELQLPLSMPNEALTNLFCAINTYPTINRKLNRASYKLQPTINCIPMPSKEQFLAVKEVANTNGIPLKPVPLSSINELEVETYTLRFQGANRFDQRDAAEKIYELLDMLRDEYASFASVGQDFLHSILLKLKQNMSRLEQKMFDSSLVAGNTPYLLVKSQQVNDIIYIDYWTSQGELANKIPQGTRAIVYNSSDIKEADSFLIGGTFGGKERINNNQKINVFKKNLLARGRVVTQEDIKSTCLAELGDKVLNVEVRKTVKAGRTPNEGFTRCIEVVLHPNPQQELEKTEWHYICQLLQQTLQQNSTGNIPFYVTVSSLNVN
jgi:hypothetical protein